MKKGLFALLLIALFITGCSSDIPQLSDDPQPSNNDPIIVNPISIRFLSLLNVRKSTIDRIDYDKAVSYTIKPPARDLTDISKNIDVVLAPFFSASVSERKIIALGDYVVLDLKLLDKDGALIVRESNAELLVGANLLDEKTESDLVGRKTNRSFKIKATDKVKEFYNLPEVDAVVINPLSILQYEAGYSTKAFLERNGFSSLEEFYLYLFDKKLKEQAFEKNTALKNNFIKNAIDNCAFTISYDDLKNYSDTVLKEHMQTAESLGMNIDEYYMNVLSLDEEGFFRMCAASAETEIKKCLVIGALSEYFNITMDGDYLAEFCKKNGINTESDVGQIYADYFCLESLVISYFVPFI